MSAESRNFLCLPTDVIWKIVEHLEPKDVLRTAAVCHELAAIISYTFYVTTGLVNPQGKCSIRVGELGGSDPKLTAVSLDFQLTTIEQLVVNFHFNTDSVGLHSDCSPQALTRDIYRLGNVVNRLSSVRSVCIVLHPTRFARWSLIQKPVQEFAIEFLHLLDIIIQKSSPSLHIQQVNPVFRDYNFKFGLVKEDKEDKMPLLRTLVSQVNTTFPSELKGKGWKYTKLYESLIPLHHSLIPSQNGLTHVDLKCDFLFVPPFSTWTFGILKSSPIISLTLSFLFLPPIDVDELRHYIFPNLVKSLPRLQDFKFEFSPGGGALSIMVENLPSFVHLAKITLGNSYYGPFAEVSPEHDANRVSTVTSITGSLDQAIHLLALSRFPNLQFVNVLIEFRYRLETHFVEIASRFHLLNDLITTKCGPTSSPRISVRLLDQGDALFAETPFPLQALLAADNRITWITHFRHITSLYLDLTVYPDMTAYPKAARRWDLQKEQKYAIEYALTWLGIFCGVEALTLLCRHPFLETSEPERKCLLSAMSIAILEEYPNVQSFDIVPLGDHTLRYWACAGDEWGSCVPQSEEVSGCHFNPLTYTRSLKPDWVMHAEE